MRYLGVDLDGISVAAAVVGNEGTIPGKVSPPILKGAEATADQMIMVVHRTAETASTTLDKVVLVGIGAPGTVEPDTGVIRYWSSLDFTNVPITALTKARLDKKILLENGASVAILREYAADADEDSRPMMAVALGAGVGGSAILNGRLYTGFGYAGMEVDHFVTECGRRLYTYGRRGCFETYCSATALIKRTRQMVEENHASRLWELTGGPERVNDYTPFDAAIRGDLVAGKIIDEYTDYLGCGVTSLVNIFQPEVICVGGGPSIQGETLMTPVHYILNREDCARNNPHRTRLVRAALGNDADLIGAALLLLFR